MFSYSTRNTVGEMGRRTARSHAADATGGNTPRVVQTDAPAGRRSLICSTLSFGFTPFFILKKTRRGWFTVLSRKCIFIYVGLKYDIPCTVHFKPNPSGGEYALLTERSNGLLSLRFLKILPGVQQIIALLLLLLSTRPYVALDSLFLHSDWMKRTHVGSEYTVTLKMSLPRLNLIFKTSLYARLVFMYLYYMAFYSIG